MYPELPHVSASSDSPLVTLQDLMAPIFRHWRAGLLVAVVLGGVTVTSVLLWPRTYDAEMTILVKRERAENIVSSAPGTASQTPPDVSEDELNSEVALLKSRDLLEQVAVFSGLVSSVPGTDAATTEDARRTLARAVRRLSSDLEVSPLRKTTLIKVGYGSSDPTLAAHVLSELGRLYLERHQVLHRPAGAHQFFSEQTARSRAELTAAESALASYDSREGVISAEVEKDGALRQLAEFEASLQRTHVEVADATRRLRQLRATAAATPARQTMQIKTSDNPELMANLRKQVLDLELKRAEMLRKFTPTYRPVAEIGAQLAQARAALKRTERTPLTERTTDENPTHRWLQNELASVGAGRAAALARVDALAASVQLFREKARTLEEKAIGQQQLNRAIKSAEDNYLLYMHKQEEARISDALDLTRISNVAIAQAPTVPALPSSAGRLFMLLIGLALAGLAGLVATFAIDYLGPYLRTPDYLAAGPTPPILSTLRAPIRS